MMEPDRLLTKDWTLLENMIQSVKGKQQQHVTDMASEISYLREMIQAQGEMLKESCQYIRQLESALLDRSRN
jgi:hypothetical protein